MKPIRGWKIKDKDASKQLRRLRQLVELGVCVECREPRDRPGWRCTPCLKAYNAAYPSPARPNRQRKKRNT